MKCGIALSALSLLTFAASGQDRPLSVERPAYDYELVEFVSIDGLAATDREILTGYLADRDAARSAFEQHAKAACPKFIGGEMSVLEFAAHLDEGVDDMYRSIDLAFRDMRNRLSSTGLSTLQDEMSRSPLWSADSRAVDIAELAPGTAESSFIDFCGGDATRRTLAAD